MPGMSELSDDEFPADYSQARARFRELSRSWSLETEAYPINALGPRGETLTIDVARSGDRRAPRCVVVSSGLHGIEGFFGSAVQAAWLRTSALVAATRADTAIVLIHALNPYGFAWERRANEDNIDPNRNFLLPDERFEGAPPRYGQLNGLLNPPHAPGTELIYGLRAGWALLRYGLPTLKQAIAGGQHEYPRGIFYGGRGYCETQRIFAAHWMTWTGQAREVLHVDLHTGLGRYADYQLLVEYALQPDERNWLADLVGGERIQEAHASGVAYEARGSIGRWCRRMYAPGRYTYLCAEFGTYAPFHMLQVLRAESQAHHYSRPDSRAFQRSKARLREAFCPRDQQWRRKALASGVELVQRVASQL